MLAVWRDWGLDVHLRTAWEQGIVLGGSSAGSICWFEQGLTDSIAGPLVRLDCLGLLAGSNCPHYDSEAQRRPTFRTLVDGRISDGVAADDGAALHTDGKLHRAISSAGRARAWRSAARPGAHWKRASPRSSSQELSPALASPRAEQAARRGKMS
jgi:peptidase E